MTAATNRRNLMLGVVGGAGLAALTPISEAKPLLFGAPPLPKIASLRLVITDFGAVGDGVTKNTLAIQQALDRCSVLGGGTVEVPAGRFVTGTIFLRSRTRLYLADGAELVGSSDLADYPLTQVRWEGKWVKGHCSLIHAVDAEDLAVEGAGKIFGSDAVGGMPSAAYPLRHPALIEPVNCRRILFESFSTAYDHMWNMHPTLCDDITIRKLTIRSSEKGRDGIDIDSCRHVRIENCDIATGDDCISLKSGRGMEGVTLARPTEDVLITGCTFADWNWACIGIGSEMSGGIRNVRVEHCTFKQAKTYAIYIKSQVGRGGFIENLEFEDCDISGTGLGAIRINQLTSGKHDENQVPGLDGVARFANFRFRKLRVHSVPQLLEGWEIHPDKPLVGLMVDGVSGRSDKGLHIAFVHAVRLNQIKLDGLQEPLVLASNISALKGAAPLVLPSNPPAPLIKGGEYRLR